MSEVESDLQPLRVASFESRRAAEMASLIARHGGEPTVAPSMREVPLEANDTAIAFGERLLGGEIDVLVFLTGVGADALLGLLEDRYGKDAVHQAVAKCQVAVRGPKPVAVLRKRGVRIDHRAGEPNTWRELVAALESAELIVGKTIAVQEYGQPNEGLCAELANRGADVVRVPIYRWDLPEDCEPLRNAIRRTIAGEIDILLFTSAQQIANVLTVAERDRLRNEFIASTQNLVVASIGPTCSEALRAAGLEIDVESSPTKMGRLVAQAMLEAPAILGVKRGIV